MAKRRKKHKLKPGSSIGDLTERLDLKWTQHDPSKQRMAECWFCHATIMQVEKYCQGVNSSGGGYTQFNACNKCAVEAGLIW